jgi:hypothetical protein
MAAEVCLAADKSFPYLSRRGKLIADFSAFLQSRPNCSAASCHSGFFKRGFGVNE